MEEWYNRALPTFIKFARSLNDKRDNKWSSRISSDISSIFVCNEIDIMTFILKNGDVIKLQYRYKVYRICFQGNGVIS